MSEKRKLELQLAEQLGFVVDEHGFAYRTSLAAEWPTDRELELFIQSSLWNKCLALMHERETMREGLRVATFCETCEGTKVFTPECMGCMSEMGPCTCSEEECVQCDGRGWYIPNSDDAKLALIAQLLEVKP